MKRWYHIREGRLLLTEDTSAPIRVFTAPDEKEREELRESLGILDYDIDSALDPDEISRVEFDNRGISIIWKQPYRGTTDGSAFEVSSVGFFLQQGVLTVISKEEIATFAEREFTGVSAVQGFLIRYFFFTVRQYLSYLKAIKQTTTQLEATLTGSTENTAFLQMFDLSESLVYYHNAIEANGAVLTKLRNRLEKLSLSSRQTALLDDAVLENQQCGRQAEIYSKVLSGLMDARGNIINNNMTQILKDLTIINIIFLPLNLIAGIGGMSEYSRFLDDYGYHWDTGFILFVVGLAALAWITWRLLRRYLGIGGWIW